ncbi:AAA family ATPase [Streptomyces sp. NPDC002677]|uniref:ATP-binding protein n=1 Tax=Streptomyces sp. NPDC002677 TaxID=3154774 RepID=UPI00332B9E95
MLGQQLHPVIGRDTEQALLERLVTDVAAGRGGSLLIEGEPGIGKSTLLAHALAKADAAGCEVLTGQCDELGRRLPLSVMTRLLGVEAGSADPRRAEAALALEQPQEAPGWTMRLLAGDPVVAATEQLLVLVDRLCASGPLVLAVEDLQWADDASLLMWRRLCRASVQLPLLVVGTCRPAPGRPELEALRRDLRSRGGQLVSLDQLPEAQVAELAGALARGVPGPMLTERLRSAAGNPLYVRELLDALARVGALDSADGRVELTATGRDVRELNALTDVIADRLASLSADAQEALRAASLLGPEFSVTDLAAAVGSGAGSLLRVVEEALGAGVLESAGSRLRFRHGLLKEVLYEAMPTPLRTAFLRRAAQELMASGAPVERVAELILPVLGTAEDWEWEWLADNAERLVVRAPVVAAELLEHALRQARADDPRLPLLTAQLAALYFRMGPLDRAEELARTVLRQAADYELIGRVRWLLSTIGMRTGRYGDVVENWRAATADARLGPVWRARLLALVALARHLLGQTGRARLAMAEALEEGRKLGDPTAVGYALLAASVIRSRHGDQTGALAVNGQALAEIGNDPELVDLRLILLGHRVIELDGVDRLQEAEEALVQARTLAERVGATRLSMTLVQSAERYYEHGRWDDALAVLDEVTDLPPLWRLSRQGLLALIGARRGQWQEAAGHLDAPGGRKVPSGGPVAAAYLLLARGLVAEHASRLPEAVAVLAELLTDTYAHDVGNHPEWLPALVRLALAADDRQTASAAALAARQEADRQPKPRALAAADWCFGLLDQDQARLLVAIDYHRTADRSPDLGNALEDLAAVQAASGDLDAARASFDEALAVWVELGADWDVRRAAARLRPLGLRSGSRGAHPRPSSGWEALTATERHVAGLVAQGLSNPDIAARLLLSRRTVETHVSHILTKLQVRSRREVGAVAGSGSGTPGHRGSSTATAATADTGRSGFSSGGGTHRPGSGTPPRAAGRE